MTDTARDHLERAIELLDALELPSVRRDYAVVEIGHALELLAIPPREPTEDQRDAARYRWLRANPVTFKGGACVAWKRGELDAVIDAAMKEGR